MNRVAIRCEGITPPPWEKACERVCKRILALLGKKNWEVSLLLCNDQAIRLLNAAYRNKDTATDVLAFAQEEGEHIAGRKNRLLAGDIVISLDTLMANAENYNVSPDEELKRLLVHGMLHLAGRDHRSDALDESMLVEQEALVRKLKEERIM
jgi:probable rRNA maturation factor